LRFPRGLVMTKHSTTNRNHSAPDPIVRHPPGEILSSARENIRSGIRASRITLFVGVPPGGRSPNRPANVALPNRIVHWPYPTVNKLLFKMLLPFCLPARAPVHKCSQARELQLGHRIRHCANDVEGIGPHLNEL
jgi:hypothetical protein